MVKNLPHYHNIYAEDNVTVYRNVFEATMGTQFTATIVKFKRDRNGRGKQLTLKDQSTGPAYWDQEIKYTMEFLVNRKWTGNTGLSLQELLNQNHALHTMIKRCAEHVQH